MNLLNPGPGGRSESPTALLRRLARPRPQTEACEFCSVDLGRVHRHLLEVPARRVLCVCDGCALRFEGAVTRYKLVPRDARALLEFRITDAEWEALSLPINLAFFVRSTPAGKVLALYPSPAGVTESLLPLSSWDALVMANPILERLEPDVEALVANRLGTPREYFIAPIDACFELAGLIRLHWRGFSGGNKVWQEIADYFDRLRAGARGIRPMAAQAVEGADE